MRYAVLSDIHSNLEAFTAVLEVLASERIDRILCLGDVIGYGADPNACLSRLQECAAVTVAGNHDLACIGKFGVDWFHNAAKTALGWTRDQLGFLELDFLRRLLLTEVVEPFTLVHGTLTDPARFEYLVEAGQAVDTLTVCRTLVCLVGHTHLPCVIEYDRSRRQLTRFLTRPDELREVTFTDRSETMRYLVNPGSVGQPRDGDPRASFAIIDTDRHTMALRRVPYDVAAAQRKIREAGLPSFLAERLASGR